MRKARCRTRSVAIAVALLIAAAAAGCGGGDKAGGAGGVVVLRIGTDDMPGRPSGAAIEELARQAKELSDGRLRIEPVFQAAGKSVPGWDQRVARMVRTGELDMGVIPARAWDTEGVTSLEALHAPFLVSSEPLVERIVTGSLGEEMLSGLDRAGVVGLALLPEDLRHPFGFARPLREPDDYVGKTIRTPRSAVAYALFRRLGATPDDLADAGEFKQGIDDGSVAGADSGFAIASSTLWARATATANVTFYPKVNSLVIGQDAWDTLTDAQQEQLREAARRTLDRVLDTKVPEREAADRFCEQGGRVVLADQAEIDAMIAAVQPVYAGLEREAGTKALIERIRELKGALPATASSAAATCGAPSADTERAAGADPHVLDGIWRMDVSYDEGVAAGLPAGVAAEELGLQTIRMEGGRYDWRWRSRHGDRRCPGTYAIAGDVVRFTDRGECNATWEAAFTLAGDTIRWSGVRSHQRGDPSDQLLRELLHSRPWKRIEEIRPRAVTFPEGMYRAHIPADFLVERGVDPGTAATNSGLMTMRFRDGRWLHETQSAGGEPDCGGTYAVAGDRVTITLDTGPECGSAAGGVLFSAGWTLRDSELRFENVRSGDGDDVFARAAWGGKPWRKIR